MSENMILAGLDIGNGYVKAMLSSETNEKPEGIRFSSSAAYVTQSHDIKTPEAQAKDVLDDIYNTMDVSFESPLVKTGVRRLFGRRGLQSGLPVEEFDVYSHISKAKQDLSGILVLGTLAGKALCDYYAQHEALPRELLQVQARIALALPINEYKKYRVQYAEGFLQNTHILTFHNFEFPVRIEIDIQDVQCVAEGAAAQYAIVAEGEPMMDSMLQDVRRLGEELPGVTSRDVLNAMNTISVDIGEGTVNFPVFQNGKFNPDASLTFDEGYGTVLVHVLDRLQDMGMAFKNRKELADFLQTPPTVLNKRRYDRVKSVLNEEMESFANSVSMQFIKVLSRVGSYIEVVYVYGGGATPMKEILHPMLVNTSKNFGGDDISYPVLYLDSRYSQYLNRKGLYTIAHKMYNS